MMTGITFVGLMISIVCLWRAIIYRYIHKKDIDSIWWLLIAILIAQVYI